MPPGSEFPFDANVSDTPMSDVTDGLVAKAARSGVTVEDLARAWASIDGCRDEFDRGKVNSEFDAYNGRYSGYMLEAGSMLSRAITYAEERLGKRVTHAMSLISSHWREGRAQAWIDKIPDDECCPVCGGSGEEMSLHRFIGGWSHIPCLSCGGSGRKQDENDWKYGDRVLVCGCIPGRLAGRTNECIPSDTWWVQYDDEVGLKVVHEHDLWRRN